MSDQALPAGLARLWRLAGPARQGRPAALDLDRIVSAAVDLADQDGLPAVTLDKVARQLGVTKMALYRYVGGKDGLVELMVDHAMTPPPAPRAGSGPWRAELGDLAHALRELYTRRGWLLAAPISGPPRGPRSIAWMDALLHTLRTVDVDWGVKLNVLLVLDSYVRQACLVEQQLRAGRGERRQVDVEHDYGAALARLVDPRRFPDAARMFAANPFPADNPPGRDIAAEDFRFGLTLVLDGIAAAVERTSTPA